SLVIHRAAQVATPQSGRRMGDLLVRSDASIAVRDGVIAWIGRAVEVPAEFATAERIDAAGKLVLPGFVDSHTHLIWAGSREAELEQRLAGKTYQEITAAGGGINATVARVRQASKRTLKELARPRLERLLRFGVTTVEVKSGYGLTLADEVK